MTQDANQGAAGSIGNRELRRQKCYTRLLAVFWTVVVCMFLSWDLFHWHQGIQEPALAEEIVRKHLMIHISGYGILWILGVVGLGLGAKRISEKTEERNRVEETLRKSEEKYRDLVENVGEIIYSIDKDGMITYASPATKPTMGYEPSEIIGKRFIDFVYHEDIPRVRDNFRNAKAGVILENEYRIVTKQGAIRWLLTSSRPVLEGDRIVSTQGTLTDITDRKQAEEALRENEERYRLHFEHVGDVVYAIDNEPRVVDISPSVERILGYRPDEIVGKRLDELQLIPPEYLELTRSNTLRVLKGERVGPTEYEFIAKDGKRVFAEISAAPIIKDGGVVGGIDIGRDITERKSAELALEESERRYRTVVDESLAGIYIHQDGRFKFVNERLSELSGYSREELLDRSYVDLIHPEDRERALEATARRLEVGKPEGLKRYRAMTKNGDVLWIEAFGVVINFQDKPAVLGNLMDITERMQAEEGLRQSEARLNSIFRATPAGIGLVSNRIMTEVNSRFCEMVGYSRDELIGNSARMLYLTDEEFELVSRNQYALIDEFGSGTVETRLKCKNGPIIDILLSSAPLNPDDLSEGITYTALDITERKQAEEEKEKLEEQLRQSQKLEAVGQLAGGVSHDFNNLLTAILGHAQLAMTKIPESNPAFRDLQDVESAAMRAAELTQHLLAFSRKQVIRPEIMDLNYTITELGQLLRRLIREDIDLRIEKAPEVWRIQADPRQIEQVLVNLVVNARDAMPGAGQILIETRNANIDEAYGFNKKDMPPGRYVMFSVSDTGEGMSDEIQQHIFEPFFTTKAEGEGTGLGLSTVYGLVRQHKGNVWVYSEIGLGTTFKVFLPATGIDNPPRRDAADKSMPRGSETILVVEDEIEVRSTIVTILSELGYNLLEAQNGSQALAMMNELDVEPSLLLTDVIMPEMGGKELAESLIRTVPEIKVLFTSGYAESIAQESGTLELEIELIQKPFSARALAQKVREVLDKQG